jgi:hypothetical protein
MNFLAAGVFTQPELKMKLDNENWSRPSPRLNVSCKLKIEGRATSAKVQWMQGDAWGPGNNWYTGVVSDCKIAQRDR